MKRRFTKLIAALALLLFVAPPMTGWGQTQTTATISSFSAVSGNIDDNISYAAYKGNGTTEPAVYDGTLRIYKPSANQSDGGYITITAGPDCELNSVTITNANDKAGTIKYNVNGGNLSEGISFAKEASYTVDGLSASFISFYNCGTERLSIAGFSVTYTSNTPQPTEPAVTLQEYEISVPAAGEEDILTVQYQNIEEINASIQFYRYDEGEELIETTAAYYNEWFTASIDEDNNVSYLVVENEGEARTAYFKVYALVGEEYVYSNLITITQAVPDYATLPFNWAGGTSSDFTALNGVTASGLGSDYASSNFPYLIKFDNTGDYIQVKCDQQPGKVTIGVKMIGGATASSITIQGSADGETFTDIETLSISGAQNSVLTLETTNGFGANDRYVKMVFTKGSNVGVGSITIAQYVAPTAQNLTVTLGEHIPAIYVFDVADQNNPLIPDGAAGTAQVTSGTSILVSPEAADGYVLESLLVNNEDVTSQMDESGAYTFIMPASDVTITATATAIPMALYSYSINGVEGATLQAPVGSTITLVAGQNLNDDFTFAGWTTDPNDVTNLLNDSYTLIDDVTTFYAVYEHTTGTASRASMTIDKNTENFPTSYGTANTFTEYTLNDKKFQIQQVYYNSDNNTDCLQFRAGGNDNGTGTIYNDESFGNISSIVLTYNTKDTKKNFTIKAGSTANPTEGTAITPSINENEYTFDLSGGNYSYFVLTNGEYAGYLDNIIINYAGGAPTSFTAYYTRVFWGEQGEEQLYDNYTVVGPSIVPSGMILNVGWNVLTNDNPANLIIEDGAQVINAVNAFAGTVFKNIAGTDFGTPEQPTNGGYYLIASPVSQPVVPSASNGFVTENWDLYAYDAAQPYEWRNYNLANDQHAFDNIQAHHGYLYASSENTMLRFAGTLNAFPSNLSLDGEDAIEIMHLVYDANSDDDLKNLTLVGNSYAETYDFMVWDENIGNYLETFTSYTLNDEGDGFNTDDDYAAFPGPLEAFFVLATGENQTVVKWAQTAGRSNPKLNVKISRQNGTLLDNAIVSFAAGSMAKKLYLTDNSTRVYFPISNKDYAVVRVQSEGEQPVNFKAKENGTYTLSIETKNVEMDYLHLIDNMTGTDVDLLATPSYTFEAKTTDYASRFRLVFSANSISEDADGDNAFAYYNGSSWTVSNMGEATLQVVDVMGRVLSSETLSGNAEVNINQPTGVYMLRLVSGDSVKVQKVVVR